MIIEHSVCYDPTISLLLQKPSVMVTMLLNSKPEDGVPIAITKRGTKFLCTYNGLKTLPAAFYEMVNDNSPTFVRNGSIHAPFVSEDEKLMYGRVAVAKLSTARTFNPKRIGNTPQEEMDKIDDIKNDHIFLVADNTFTKYHTY